jgi:hypothetical protein
MLGNLWEWVQDDYTASGRAMKTLRGGSFFNVAGDLRASSFLWAAPDPPTGTWECDAPGLKDHQVCSFFPILPDGVVAISRRPGSATVSVD